MAITKVINTFPTPPDSNTDTPAEFNTHANDFVDHQANTFAPDVDIWAGEANTLATDMNNTAVSSANNYGAWDNLTGALNIPASVNHAGSVWILNNNLADVTLSEPSGGNADWTETATSDEFLAKLNEINTFTATQIFLGIQETVVALAGATLTVDNGTIQTKTATANVVFLDSLLDGQSMTLYLNGGDGYTITYPTITWLGGAAPTLTASDTLVFNKVGSTLYGSYAGTLVVA